MERKQSAASKGKAKRRQVKRRNPNDGRLKENRKPRIAKDGEELPKIGRPEYQPTDDDREKVKILIGQGMSVNAAAAVLNISAPTFRKCFAIEMDVATARVRAEMLMARYRAALAGNVSAQSKILDSLDAAVPKPEKERKEQPLGKKEAITQAARQATSEGEWGEILQDEDTETIQ